MQLNNTTLSRGLLKSISVLYVEDDPNVQKQLARFLSKTVGSVYAAANGQEGLEAYKQYKPDVVITDIRMPILNGLELARLIREIDQDVPIIVTTAFNEQEYFLRAIDAKITKYVLKPTDPFMLLDTLTSIVNILMSKKEKDLNNQYIRFILDDQPNFMLATNHYEVEYINRTFLNYLGYSSLDDLKKANVRLEDFFLEIKGVPFSGEERHNWLQNIINTPDRDILVYFKNKENPEGSPDIYLIACNRFPEIDKYFFTFTDITRIEEEKQDLGKQTITDILTGVFNRKKMLDTLAAEINRNERYNTPFSLIMFDIDHFKEINDTYGHCTGDQVLKEITRIVSEHIRNIDTLARWGGDEFLILAPETDIEKAKPLADKLNSDIKQFRFVEDNNVTCSFGVAQFNQNEDIDNFIKRVDGALYKAKSSGRATVAV